MKNEKQPTVEDDTLTLGKIITELMMRGFSESAAKAFILKVGDLAEDEFKKLH